MALPVGAGSEELGVGVLSGYWADEGLLRKEPCRVHGASKRGDSLTQEQRGLAAVGCSGVPHSSRCQGLPVCCRTASRAAPVGPCGSPSPFATWTAAVTRGCLPPVQS